MCHQRVSKPGEIMMSQIKPRANPPSFSYSMEDLDCKLCLYYGGKENHEAICLAAECCCKDEIAAAKSREKRF